MSASKDFDHADVWDHYSEKFPGSDAGSSFDVLGQEWGSDELAKSIVELTVVPHLPAEGARIVEFGPGGGKFSRLLHGLAEKLTLVDVSQGMLDRAAAMCPGPVDAVKIDGVSLQPIEDASADLVFVFDVFVHLEPEEIFRYLAEINRILVPGGVLVLHVLDGASLEGMHAFLHQVAIRHDAIGSRFPGRLHPLSRNFVESMTHQSGFLRIDGFANELDRDDIGCFRKEGDAQAWRFLMDEDLSEAYELMGRIGGSGRRMIHAAIERQSGETVTLVVGEPGDALVEATASFPGLDHDLAVDVRQARVIGPYRIIECASVRGLSVAAWLRWPEPVRSAPPTPEVQRRFLEGVALAHERGFAHGELSIASVLWEPAANRLVAPGLVAVSGLSAEDRDALHRADVQGAAIVLHAFLAIDQACVDAVLKADAADAMEQLRRALDG